jgi:hypothetical protein
MSCTRDQGSWAEVACPVSITLSNFRGRFGECRSSFALSDTRAEKSHDRKHLSRERPLQKNFDSVITAKVAKNLEN